MCQMKHHDYYRVRSLPGWQSEQQLTFPARVAVHFIDVTERFAPHDFVLSISTPEELSDAALTAACTLHTAAPSSSSSSGSSRGQKLSWIQEAAEEGNQPGGDENKAASQPNTAKSIIPTIVEPIPPIEEVPEQLPNRVTSIMSDGAESVPLTMEVLEEKAPERKQAPQMTHVTIEKATEAPTTPEELHLTDMQETLKSYDKLFENGPEPRTSSQTARPNYDELYEHYYSQYSKPKVKLGPRPRPSLEGKRPSTSGSVPQAGSRPKSSLPAGLRSATRKAADERAAKSRDVGSVPSLVLPPPPPIPAASEAPSSPISLAFTARIPASVRSMPVSAYSSHHRSTGMTQEKTRLMKALELRKKQQKVQVARQEKLAEQAVATSQAEAKEAEALAADNASIASKDVETSDGSEASEKKAVEKQSLAGDDTTSSFGLDSSALGFTSSQADTDDLHSAVSISSPTSAQTQGSSGAPSTRPSSISEDDTPVANDTYTPEQSSDSQSSNSMDEEQSVDSLPTVVPENRTPVPSMIQADQQTNDAERASVEAEDGAQPSISEGLRDSQAKRRSKRESMLFVPSGGASPLDDAMFKKRNRESVIMPTINYTPGHQKRQSWYETKDKRRALLDLIQISADNSEAEYLSDDSFMEELQSATVHEAKPMSVSKSPIMPYFSRKSPNRGSMASERSASQTYMRSRGSPEPMPRQISGPWPPQANVEKVGVAKKINVSSGISQRIKALAEKSSRELSPPVTPVNGPESSSHSLAQRKSSFFATTPLETSPNSRPVSRLGNPAFLNSSTSSTPEKKKTAKPAQPIKATVYNVQRANEQPESVQVTARIVRDERTMKPMLAMPNESTPLDLHQSQLTIDHHKPKWTPPPTRGRPEPTSPKAPSTSHSREQSIGPSRTSSESGWRGFGRRMSDSKSIHSHDSDAIREDKKEKKESRTSKMFKRMSSMSAMPWKNSSSNLILPEHSTHSPSLASLREPPPAVHVGDLNIQFPDTLLWKRRYVEIDSMGNLVLSPSKSNEKGIVKRFHLSEFRAPYPPDQDRQELPNSVVLDFVDGRTLQCACETYIAQAQVLQSKFLDIPIIQRHDC